MGYTHYMHTTVKEDNVREANILFQNLLFATRSEDNDNLYNVFIKSGLEDGKTTSQFEENFHEVTWDSNYLPLIRNLDVQKDFDFLKTARKKSDIAILLSYMYLAFLSGDINKMSSDMKSENEKKLKQTFLEFAKGTYFLDFKEALIDYIESE